MGHFLVHFLGYSLKCPKSGGEDIYLILSAALLFLHDLCHEIAHLFGGAFLHLARDVGVGAKGKPCVKVTEHTRYGFHVHAVMQSKKSLKASTKFSRVLLPAKPRITESSPFDP